MKVLVTGGCGYIGSHQVVSLLEAGHDAVILDSLYNSDPSVLEAIEKLTGRRPSFYEEDVRSRDLVCRILQRERIDAIIHMAGLKHVRESTSIPVDYHDVNGTGMLSVVKAADEARVRRLVFSSSGSIYGEASGPLSESDPIAPTNPYSASKAYCERVLSDLCDSNLRWSIVALRYFNPAGAHSSGLIGENPTRLSTNLVPALLDTAMGLSDSFTVHGDDFDTPDGTALRDYIHVVDVAAAHLAALSRTNAITGFRALNVGRGQGVSVKQVISAVERVTNVTIPVEIGPRQRGDVSSLFANVDSARQVLGLRCDRSIDQMCADAWRFRKASGQQPWATQEKLA